MKYPFIVINLRSALTQIGSTCNGLSMCQIDPFKNNVSVKNFWNFINAYEQIIDILLVF